MNNTMNNTNMDFCTQCPNHCPVTDLQCGRGRHFFGHQHDSQHGSHHGPHHGSHHGRGLSYKNDDLYGMMRACGHYLYHCTGSGAGQGKILGILSERESLTQKELQEMLQIQPGSMSEILAKLEEKGLILRKKQDDDKRRSVLFLTDAGKEAVRDRKQNQEELLFASLEKEEQEELKRLLGKMLKSWN